MTESEQDAILREKTLYRYSSAVERGDFETAAAILAQAENDPELEHMIVEINAALAEELPPAPRVPARTPGTFWQRARAALRSFAPGVGLSALVLLMVFGVLALMGPAVGNTFSNITQNLSADNRKARQIPAYPTSAPAAPESSSFKAPEGYPAPRPTATFYFPRQTPVAAAGATSYPGPAKPAEAYAQAAAPTATPVLVGPGGQGIATATTSAASGAPMTVPTNQPRMVARNGYLVLTVADTRKVRDTVNEMISGYAGEGAYVVSSTEMDIPAPDGQPADQPAISMQLRVPVARYDPLMNRLVGMALKVDARQEQASDVTAEYVDTQARIKELETAIDRLLEIARSAKDTQDLLTVEKALSDRRAELEAMKGRAQYLSQTAALSLIQLELRPRIIYPTPTVTPTRTPTPIPTPEAWRPGETAHRSVVVLLNDLRHFGDALIVFGITTLPWIVVFGLVVYGGYRVVRRKK